MASGLVVHISSGDDKHTEILTGDLIRIGHAEDCDLRLRASALPPSSVNDGPVLELSRNSGHYHITGFDHSLEITHNNKAIAIASEIRDGDEICVHPSGLALQFFPIRSLPAVIPPGQKETHVAPFIEAAAIESAATAPRDDAKIFLREFTRELVREIKVSTKLIALAISLILVGGILYIGFALYHEVQTSRRIADKQREETQKVQEELNKANQQIADMDVKNRNIQNTLSPAVKYFSEYSKGVCLISGSFYFVESGTGRPLRYPEAQTGDAGSPVPGPSDQQGLTPDGQGAVAEFEFVGSGFYVGQGYVMTNRHIAQPWLADERAQSLSGTVHGQPRLKKLNAYFPDYTQPMSLKVKQTSARDDLAVCMLDAKDIPKEIPALPLDGDAEVAVGNVVVMMGYPSGPDRLLALLDESESRGIQQRHGTLDSLLGFLAETKRIRPLTTQGN